VQIKNSRFVVHGLGVELSCDIAPLELELSRQLGEFSTPDFPENFSSITGSIRPYIQDEVLRHVSPKARPIFRGHGPLEIYQRGPYFWAVGERWGLTHVDLHVGKWQSWVVSNPQLDLVRCAEMSALWPMAQILRFKGIHLIPAISVARDGWGVLILSTTRMDAELSALASNGWKIIGQRWTALREEDGKVSLLHMPGRVERSVAPRLRIALCDTRPGWVDLNTVYPNSHQHHAFCNAVVIASPGRRDRANLRPIAQSDAVHALRRAWPTLELDTPKQRGQMAIRLAQRAHCSELQLSRRGADAVELLEKIRLGHRHIPHLTDRSAFPGLLSLLSTSLAP